MDSLENDAQQFAKDANRLERELAAEVEQRQAAEAEVARLSALVYVPGLWRCAKCDFTLIQSTLRASAIGMRDDPGEKCPNCTVPLWRVTERQAGTDMVDRATEALERATKAERTIALLADPTPELVETHAKAMFEDDERDRCAASRFQPMTWSGVGEQYQDIWRSRSRAGFRAISAVLRETGDE